MKKETSELITQERRRDTFNFITGIVQHNRKRPAKYKHYLRIPVYLYEELTQRGVIDLESYYINEDAFFEFTGTDATISFVCLYACEDLHRKIDHYLVVKFAGSYPLTRGCSSSI